MKDRYVIRYIVWDTYKNKNFYDAFGCEPFESITAAKHETKLLNELYKNVIKEYKTGMNNHGYWLKKDK